MNYLCLNDKKIELTESQIAEIKKGLGITENVELGSIEKGEDFKIGEYEFFVYGHTDEGVIVVLKNLLHTEEEFGDCNNYDGSNVDKLCQDFYEVISQNVGADNMIEYELDLTADDGLKDYGTVKRKMSLITANMYRQEVELFDKHKVDKWWWTATAYSTPVHDDDCYAKCVSPRGFINDYGYDNISGVRPFCILKSNIFVSK